MNGDRQTYYRKRFPVGPLADTALPQYDLRCCNLSMFGRCFRLDFRAQAHSRRLIDLLGRATPGERRSPLAGAEKSAGINAMSAHAVTNLPVRPDSGFQRFLQSTTIAGEGSIVITSQQ